MLEVVKQQRKRTHSFWKNWKEEMETKKKKKKVVFEKQINKHPISLFGREFFVLGLNCWMKGIKRRGLEDEIDLDFE